MCDCWICVGGCEAVLCAAGASQRKFVPRALGGGGSGEVGGSGRVSSHKLIAGRNLRGVSVR